MKIENQCRKLKYRNYFLAEEGVYLVGIPKDDREEKWEYLDDDPEEANIAELSLFCSHPIKIYENEINEKIQLLNPNNRGMIYDWLDKITDTLQSEAKQFDGLYWDILLDVILHLYKKTSYALARELMMADSLMNNFEDVITEKTLYDNIETMRQNKRSLQKNGIKIAHIICYSNMVTETFIFEGEGILFWIEDENKRKKYNVHTIEQYCQKHQNINLKKMIADITGIDKKDILEIPIKAAMKKERFSPKEYKIIDCLIDVVKERESRK